MNKLLKSNQAFSLSIIHVKELRNTVTKVLGIKVLHYLFIIRAMFYNNKLHKALK